MKISRGEVFKNIAWLGGTLVIAGTLRYLIQETWQPVSKWLLISGAILFVLGIGGNFDGVLAFFRRRGTKLGTNTAVLSLAVLAILALVNFLGARHNKRFDLTAEKIYSLSDQTVKIVSGLQKDVQVLKFDKADDTTLRDLMAEYKNHSRKISYQFVDPQEKPEIAKQYGVQRFGETVVVSGTRVERPETVDEAELTSAILKVTRDAVKTVCFVEGHGEKALTSQEGEGYSTVEAGLKSENYQVKTVNLVSANEVPADCSVLVEAGPTKALFAQEAAMIGKFLDGGGKAMLLLDPDTDPQLDGILQAWNVAVGKDTVLDVSGYGRLIGTGPGVPLVMTYGAHAITKNFGRTMTIFPLARSVKQGDKPQGGEQMSELLTTSPESWAETELKGGKAKFDEGKDTKGPVSLGVAASKKVGEKEARLVVIGDSDFASNRYLGEQRNGDLFFNAINWLAQDEELISIRPKSPANRRVNLTRSQQNMFFWFSIVLLPGAVVVAGAIIWWKRR
ncbi:MAG: GldG family protein [Acidobacteria bacterium]|nr:GldG family protein [Acidobacteriota bacterium]